MLVGAARSEGVTDWVESMESSIYSKCHQSEPHRLYSPNTQSSRQSAGALTLSGFGPVL